MPRHHNTIVFVLPVVPPPEVTSLTHQVGGQGLEILPPRNNEQLQ